MMRRRSVLALLLLLAAAAATGAAEEAVRLLGKVKAVDPDAKGLDFQAKGGPYRIALEAVEVVAMKAVKLKEAGSGAGHVLGRRQAEARNPSTGGRVPAQIVQIQTIVLGDGFQPPPLPPDLAEKKLEWISGQVSVGDTSAELSGTNMQVGLERPVVVLDMAAPEDLVKAKGKPLFVEGTREAKTIKATRVTLVAPDVPAAELKVILGL